MQSSNKNNSLFESNNEFLFNNQQPDEKIVII